VAALDRSAITGLILAGGRGTRLGGEDKGLALFQGRRLVEHAIERLFPQVATVIVSANRNRERYEALGWPVVADDDATFAGPLAGMLAGLRAARTDWLATVPCDAPHFPSDLVAQLVAGIGSAHAAVASVDGKAQPVFCLLHRSAADSLAPTLRANQRAAVHWLTTIGAQTVPFANARAFANLNTAQDFAAALA